MEREETGCLSPGIPDNWASKVEDLLDDGDRQGAKRLLERIVAQFQHREELPTDLLHRQQQHQQQEQQQARSDSPSSLLTLASALQDLATLYGEDGLSLKADSLATSALVIKNKLQAPAAHPSPLLPSDEASSLPSSEEGVACLEEGPAAGKPSTSHSNLQEEEDWEMVLCDDIVKLNKSPVAGQKARGQFLPQKKTPASKQRGRGAFTYGEMGMHSDRLNLKSSGDESKVQKLSDETEERDIIGDTPLQVAYGIRHVLALTFPPQVVTKDLEDLFQPLASHEFVIRWVNDTNALAVFRSPDAAKEALRCIRNPQYHVRELGKDAIIRSLVSEKDLEPPIPRPATSSHAAHRMIMGALQKQGLTAKAPSKSTFQDIVKQEAERKQRLLSRQKLRDEAWGSDE